MVIIMIRHFSKRKLKNPNLNRKLVLFQKQTFCEDSFWQMPPYIIAKFGGELTQVMLNAAEQYIFEKSLAKQKKDFKKEAFQNEKPL